MHSTQSLLFQSRVRRHDSDKKARKQQRTIRMQKIYAFLYRIIDPLCAGLAGTWVINDSNEKATAILTDDIADTLVAADAMQEKPSSDNVSADRSSNRRNIRGNSSLNENLSREKQSHDRPRFSPIQSAKRGFNAGRNLGRKKK